MPGEAAELESCEQIIERGLETFIEVGLALSTIRERRLYRVSFDTFEEYCLARWEIRASRARQLCAAAETVRNLGLPPGSVTTGNAFALPASERQARPLVGLPPEEQRAAWSEAVATAPGGRVTASHVEQVVQARRAKLGLLGPAPPLKLASETPGSQSKAPGGPGGSVTMVTLSREVRALAEADRAVIILRGLVELIGTVDSEASAKPRLAMEMVEDFKSHLARVAMLQESRR